MGPKTRGSMKVSAVDPCIPAKFNGKTSLPASRIVSVQLQGFAGMIHLANVLFPIAIQQQSAWRSIIFLNFFMC